MDQGLQIQVTKEQHYIQTLDACSSMIANVRQLKLSVLDLFSTLADNGPDPLRNQPNLPQESMFNNTNNGKLYHQQTLSNLNTSHTICSASVPPIMLQRQQEQQQINELLQYVNKSISSIASLIRGLDQDFAVISQNSNLMNIGELGNLAIEGSADKHDLYMDVCKAYKNLTKLHDYSKDCHRLLMQQSLKRIHKRSEYPSHLSQAGRDVASSNSIVASFNPYLYRTCSTSVGIMKVLDNSVKSFRNFESRYSQPFGSSTGVYQIGLNKVLRAVLVMRGIVIDAVIVKAYHESFARKSTVSGICSGGSGTGTASGGQILQQHLGPSASNQNRRRCAMLMNADVGVIPFEDPDDDLDLWSESKYAVFRKLTYHANAAVLHFQYPTLPEIAIQTFLSWFYSYSDLFAATCSKCNTRLRKFMPPICRDFSPGFHPHHDSCK